MTTLAACALSGTALALYYHSKSTGSSRTYRKDSGDSGESRGGDGEDVVYNTHLSLYRAPTSFFEDLYFFVEGLRFFYGETLYKWKTADLLIGLYYLCQNSGPEQLADVGRSGRVFALEDVDAGEIEANRLFLRRLERCFRYNSCLRERRPMYRKRRILQKMGISNEDILKQATSAGVLKPSYVLVKDDVLKNIVLIVRGTHSLKDAFTSLTGASKPHHVVDSNGVTLGYSHFGMLAAARWLKGELFESFRDALERWPGYDPLVIGHSLGGGAAAMLTMMLREQGGVFERASCIAIACPACMTLELAESCKEYVTSIVNGCDAIPTLSSGAADSLRDQVMASEWSSDFHEDMRRFKLYRAFESTKSWVASQSRRQMCGMNGGNGNAFLSRMRGVLSTYWWKDASNHRQSYPEREGFGNDDGNEMGIEQFSGEEVESLRAEASFRMQAVQNAVLDAEAEEVHEQEAWGGESGMHVPSVIRPGNYGGSPGTSPSRARSGWKRFMYPAGRIMHFVPAHVVPGYEDSDVIHECDSDDGLDSQDDEPDNQSAFLQHHRQVSELGLEFVLGGEEVLQHSASVISESHHMEGPLPPLKPAPGPAPKNMILLDHVPQTVYAKMRPSTTILTDHVIPNYVRSLQSFKKRYAF
jgi:hypothetical protein